ncbi:MAG: MFS transporter, partial [Comamonas sp.]
MPASPPSSPSELNAAPTGVLLALSLAAALSALSLRLTDALLPWLSHHYQASMADTAWVVTAFALSYGLALLVLGSLGDRFGKLRVITLSCAASGLASAACAWAPDLPSLIAARAFTGAATASLIPLAMAWIGDHVPFQQRQPVLARFLLGQILGMSLGAGLGGLAADYLTPAAAFLSMGLAYGALTAALSTQQRRLPPAAVPHTASHSWWRAIFHSMHAVLSQSWPRTVLLTAATEGALLFGVIAFAATHLHQQHGLRLSHAGAMVMLFGLGGAMYALGSRHLLRRMGERGLVQIGGCTMALGMVVLAWTPVWWGGMAACWLCGLGYYMMHNTLQTQATQMAPAHRGAAVSLYACCFFLGQALGVALMGMALQHIHSAWAMTACAIGLL